MRRHELGLAIALTLVLAAAGWMDPAFVRLPTQLELAGSLWETALLAVPMAFIVISGGIDLSVGSTTALCSVLFALASERSVPTPVSMALALVAGAAAGLLNGTVIVRSRVHPLIVTLATFSAYRGLAEGLSLGRGYSSFPAWFGGMAPVGPWLALVALLAGALLLERTPFGRTVSAVGNNETACRFSGLPVDRAKRSLYVASGVAAALVALLFAMRRHTAKADVGTGMELEAITAVVLGGVRIQGGKGSILGVGLGLLLLHEVRQFVSWRWAESEVVLVATGLLLIASVAVTSREDQP